MVESVCERGQERRDGGDESKAGVVVHTLELFLLNLKLPVYSHGCVGKHRKHPSGRGNACGQHHHRIMFDKFLIVTYQNSSKVSALVYLPNKATGESTFQRERKVTLMSCPASTV